MLELNYPKDCNNAPRKAVLRDFNVAFANSDIDLILKFVHDDVVWRMVGDSEHRGKQEMRVALEGMKGAPAVALDLEKVITHGRTASANGTLTFSDGKKVAFCDVYEFAGHAATAPIREIVSYAISLDD